MGYAPGPLSLAGTLVTPQTALTFTAYFAGVNVISTDVASLPLGVYRRLPDGKVVPAPEMPQHKLLHVAPNEEQNAFRFRQHQMGHTLGWGNGLAEIVRRGGDPDALYPLDPSKTRPERTRAGRLVYVTEKADGRKVPIPPEDVIHVAGLGFDGLQGYSPVTLARQAIGLGLGAEHFGAALFGNGAIPKGILTSPKRLSEVAARNLRESVERVHQGSANAHRLMVLEDGVTWTATQINPDDAQFLATRQFQVVEIARMLRLPPHKLGDYSQAHLANIEESNLDYLQTTLLGWVCIIEAELNLKLFSEDERADGYFVRHDMSALMRGNMAARTSYYQGMRNMGVMSADDIATREGFNPLPPGSGGDLYIVQGQYVPLSSVGKEPLAPPAPEARFDGREGDGEQRYNPYHGPDGKFTSAHGGGKHGKVVPSKKAPASVKEEIARVAEMRRDPSSHTDHDPGFVGEIKTGLIHFDPERFQYKLAAQGEHGVTDALHGVKRWDPNLGGILQVWKDPADGKAYVVNGHHRLDLANKLGAEKVAVRFIHADDAAHARGIGALTNIAEGRGNSVDAAKFFRDTGLAREHLEAKGIPMKERVATEGVALANLHKPIFDRVISGDLTPARGAIIGDGLTHAQQASVVKTLDKFGKAKAPSDATLRQTVLHARSAPVTKVKTHDLFGDNEDDVSLAFHRGEASAHVMERLSREKRVFGTVAKEHNAADLERGGNVIDALSSGKISKEAAQNLDTFTLLQHRSGPVSHLLNEAAERVHKGEKKKAVHDDLYRRLPQAVHEALNGGLGAAA